MPTHADVLNPDEHELWLAVRSERQRVRGDRYAAIAAVATASGLDADELNGQIADMKARLVDEGVVATHHFFVVASPTKTWSAASVVTGTDRWRELTDSRALRFESLRFAFNAAAALTALELIHPADRERFAGHLRCAIDDPDAQRSVERFDGYGDVVVARYRDTVGFGPDGQRPWTGTVAQARWIADSVAAGAVEHLDGTVRYAAAGR